MADQRPNMYEEQNRWVLRASSFGSCQQALVRSALGQTPAPMPDAVLAGMNAGIDAEPKILAQLPESGWNVMDARDLTTHYSHVGTVDSTGQLSCDLAFGKGVIRCHPDGIGVCYKKLTHRGLDSVEIGQHRVIEVKFLRDGTPHPFTRPLYRWQFAIQMHVTKLDGLYVIAWKNPDGEIDRIQVEAVDRVGWCAEHKVGVAEVKKRARGIVTMVEQARGEGMMPPCDWKQYPCGFYAEHDKTEGSIWHVPPAVELKDAAAAEAFHWMQRWTNAHTREQAAKEDKARAREALVGIAKDNGVEAGKDFAIGGWRATLVRQERAGTVDMKKMAAEGVDVEKYRGEPKISEWVTVKGPDE